MFDRNTGVKKNKKQQQKNKKKPKKNNNKKNNKKTKNKKTVRDTCYWKETLVSASLYILAAPMQTNKTQITRE